MIYWPINFEYFKNGTTSAGNGLWIEKCKMAPQVKKLIFSSTINSNLYLSKAFFKGIRLKIMKVSMVDTVTQIHCSNDLPMWTMPQTATLTVQAVCSGIHMLYKLLCISNCTFWVWNIIFTQKCACFGTYSPWVTFKKTVL